MADKNEGETWGRRLALRIGTRLQGIRKARGLSAEEVAVLTAEIGHRVSRQSLVNLEAGRKVQVALDDLIALSFVLGVSPMYLLVEPKSPHTAIELVPGLEVSHFEAQKWLAGMTSVLSGEMAWDDFDDWRTVFQTALQLDRLRRDVVTTQWDITRIESQENPSDDAEQFGRALKSLLESKLQEIATVSGHMRAYFEVDLDNHVDDRENIRRFRDTHWDPLEVAAFLEDKKVGEGGTPADPS